MFLCLQLMACAQEKQNNIQTQPDLETYTTMMVVPDLEIPWAMTWLPDGSMLITEKKGSLLHVKDGIKTNIKNMPEVYFRGQGGLLDIALHPKYETNDWIYMTYASSEGELEGAHTALIRGQLKDNTLVNIEKLYKGSPNVSTSHHFGSRIAFDTEGYLYFSIGERGQRDVNPQDITRDGGKIYRLHDDGRIPEDNPFYTNTNAKKAIYSYGHRNPQGMAKHPETGQIWIHEHGPKGGDEINVIKKGANFGWPEITYGVNYSGTTITDETSRPGMEQPLHYWVPSIAPSGMAFVTSDHYPEWKNKVLVGSLKFQYLELLELKNNVVVQRTKLAENIGRIRDVRQGPDGYVYIAVEGSGILKLIPNN